MAVKKPKKRNKPGAGRPTKFLAKYEDESFYNGFISECRVNYTTQNPQSATRMAIAVFNQNS